MQLKILSSQIELYVRLIESFYAENHKSLVNQVDTLILLFKITYDQKVFELLLKCHKYLLSNILNGAFHRYKKHLYKEDYEELQQMLYGEFFRRILYYKFPPEAPFSSYIKMYLSKWLNTYIKIMCKKNNRTILFIDYYKK